MNTLKHYLANTIYWGVIIFFVTIIGLLVYTCLAPYGWIGLAALAAAVSILGLVYAWDWADGYRSKHH